MHEEIHRIDTQRRQAHCGDRVRYVSRHGDYAGSALITYDRNDMLTVCICPYDPFASRTKDGVQCCSSGGPFTHVAAAAFRYEGPGGVLSKSGVTTDLAATGRSASKPKSRGGATANPIRSMATLRPRRGAGSMSIGSNGRAAAIFTARTAGRSATKQRSRRSCTTTKLPYFRDVRPGSWSSGATALRRDLCRRSSGMRSTRRSPDCRIYNVPQPVKILYDDLRHERIVYYVPPTLHIH